MYPRLSMFTVFLRFINIQRLRARSVKYKLPAIVYTLFLKYFIYTSECAFTDFKEDRRTWCFCRDNPFLPRKKPRSSAVGLFCLLFNCC